MAAIAQNLLAYNVESIETDASGWGTATNCSLTRSTSSALDGTASLSTKSTAAGAMSTKTAATAPVPTGALYVAFGSGVTASASLAATVTLTWYDSGGTSLGTSTATSTATGSWGYVHSGAAVPAGAVAVAVTLPSPATAANQTVLWDRIWITSQSIWTGNLLPYDAQCVEASVSGWGALKNCALTVSPAGNYASTFGSSLQITATAAGDTEARSEATGTVTAGTEVMGTAWVACTSAVADFRVELWWYDASSAFLSLASKSWAVSASTWTRITVIATAPTGATGARLVIRPQATAAGQVLYADQMGLVPTVTGYTIAGNLLGYNAQDLEQDAAGWTAVSGCSIARSPTAAWSGTYSLAITASGSGDAVVQLAAPVPVSPGQAYQFVPWLRWPGTPSGHSVRLDWLDAGGNTVRSLTSVWSDSGLTAGSWGTGSTADLCPATATQLECSFIIPAPTAGTVWYLDHVLVAPGGLAAVATALIDEYAAQLTIQGLTTGGLTYYSVQRIAPDGSYQPVRGTAGDLTDLPITVDALVVDDYEAALGVPVQWLVSISRPSTNALFAYTTDPITLDGPTESFAVLKDPLYPAADGAFEVITVPDWTYAARAGIYQVRNNPVPVVISDVRSSGTGTLVLNTETGDEETALGWLLGRGTVLLMQPNPGLGMQDMYVSVGDVDDKRRVRYAGNSARTWNLPLTVASRPYGGVVGTAGRDCDDVLAEATTCLALMGMYDTCLGLLTGVEGT